MQILHISDLHYGKFVPKTSKDGKQQSSHVFTDNLGDPDPQHLAKILTKQDSKAIGAPDALVISGDLGWTGDSSDYEYALKFLHEIRTAWPKTIIVIAAGNHDVSWELSKSGQNPQRPFIEFLQKFYGPDFVKFFLYETVTGTDDRHFLAAIHEEKDAIFVSVNTAADLHHEPEKDPVYVSPKVLIELENRLTSIQHPNSFKVFVMHHHLLPFKDDHWSKTYNPSDLASKVDTTIVANSAQLQKWLARLNFDLLLHGHKHTSHVRSDTLQTRNDTKVRNLIIAGAGSAGVHGGEIAPSDRNSYNIISVNPLARNRWLVDIEAREIDRDPTKSPDKAYSFRDEAGVSLLSVPRVFSSQDWILGHATIAHLCGSREVIDKQSGQSSPIHNFVSVLEAPPAVNSNNWVPPATGRIGDIPISKDDIERTFRVLHPEFARSNGWKQLEKIAEVFREQDKRFHFQHGTRLFWPDAENDVKGSPIIRAVESISSQPTRAYASTYRVEMDSRRNNTEPMPSLMSVQFIREHDRLNLVATFRNLELAFWWVFNTVEMSRLLYWAIDYINSRHPHDTLTAGTITFMSSLADWRWDPKAPRPASLDYEPLDQLAKTIFAVLNRKPEAILKLCGWLQEKVDTVNYFSLDDRGLRQVEALIKATSDSDFSELQKNIDLAAIKIGQAIRDEDRRADLVDSAKEAINIAIASLQKFTNPTQG